ncbi:PQQ-like beta-propeller repeat protein [Natrinema zhouii]|uniref:PQQ-binding-like beta-propeller repeat protein n=1 Tax=Natrinema zhouii TaxID=1710539 RepID=A0A7D6CQF4_9EURY|nr:PQQ-binding-like beta-propeller repeat protein [Natrinema zhouii]QLK27477.1 PQQ-like beta-propeller repeat protein [Natrinema zhouii]
MEHVQRRSVLALGAAFATGGILASSSSGSSADETDSSSFTAGHPDGWSSPAGNPANSNYLPLEGGFPEPDTIAWRYDETGRVAVADGTAYIVTSEFKVRERDYMHGFEERYLHAVDTDTGDRRWKTELPITRVTDIIDGGRIAPFGGPTVTDGAICVTGVDHVTALDTADGSIRWEREFSDDDTGYEIGHQYPSSPVVPTPTVAFETVYIVASGTLYALDADNGSTRWKRETVEVQSEETDTGEPHAASLKSVAPSVANGSIYVAIDDTKRDSDEYRWGVGAFDAETGEEQWGRYWDISEHGWGVGTVVATGNAVYAINYPREAVFEISLENRSVSELDHDIVAGTADTSVTADKPHRSRTPLVAGETILTTQYSESDDRRSIVGLDLEDETEEWRLESDDVDGSPVAVDGRTLYLRRDDPRRDDELVAVCSSDDGSDTDDGSNGDDDTDGSDDGGNNDSGGDGGDSDGVENDENGTDSDSGDGDDGTDAGENDTATDDDGTDAGENDTATDDDGTDAGENDTATDDDGTDDGQPGFGPVAGLTGGALTLEWLRRRTAGDNAGRE